MLQRCFAVDVGVHIVSVSTSLKKQCLFFCLPNIHTIPKKYEFDLKSANRCNKMLPCPLQSTFSTSGYVHKNTLKMVWNTQPFSFCISMQHKGLYLKDTFKSSFAGAENSHWETIRRKLEKDFGRGDRSKLLFNCEFPIHKVKTSTLGGYKINYPWSWLSFFLQLLL